MTAALDPTDPDPHDPTDPDPHDAADPLAGHRDRFVGAEDPLVYLDGNSLGRPLRVTVERLGDFVAHAWGGRLIRGWDEAWFDLPLTLGDTLARVCLGAAPGTTVVADSTTVLLYKTIRALADHQRRVDPARTELVVARDDFPTDRYVVEGIAAESGLTVRWLDVPAPGADGPTGITPELVASVVGPSTGVVVLSHVAYRSGWLADLPAVTAVVHDAGALVLWDLCHSAGVVPLTLEADDVDAAVGCGYKFLGGGPGAPAFVHVAPRLQEALEQPVRGWMGHADPFRMGPTWEPAPGMRRFLSGTPPVVGMQPLVDQLALLDEVGVPAVRAKSTALTSYAVEVADALLAPLGVRVDSPRDPARRGSHVILGHPRMREVVAALWWRDVLPDFREPDGLRVGLAPLSTSYAEVRAGLDAVAEVLRALDGA